LGKKNEGAKGNFEEQFMDVDPQVIELIRGMLTYNSEKRMTVDQALKHPYFEGIYTG